MINFVVALASEARPLIEHYKLSLLQRAHGFRIYSSDTARLVVTGVGKVNAAAGTAYLAGFDRHGDQAWLNIGIAGHRSLGAGTATFALKITDRATGRSWYPPQMLDMPGLGMHVTTYDSPMVSYPVEMVCEMEASAYYSVATRFSSGEVVQCYKIISDNETTSVSALTAGNVACLISDHVNEIVGIAQSLHDLAGQLPRSEGQHQFDQFVERWHFTVSQQVMLRDAIRKARARRAEGILDTEQWKHCRSAREVLSDIDIHLKSLPVAL